MTNITNERREQPLESWKEIASYLKRDVRTVIRWEKREGLPVHRQMHQARGSVFAYPSELEDWKASRDLRLTAPPVITPWRRATAGFGIVAAMLLALVTMGSGPIRAPIAAAAENANALAFTKIHIPTRLSALGVGDLSPDGGKFVFSSEGSIWAVPVHGKVNPAVAGAPRRLTEPMPGWVVGPAWSADGKWIAFNNIVEEEESIYVVPSEGGRAKKIPVKVYRGSPIRAYRLSLSPDGKLLAFASTGMKRKGKPAALRIYTVPVEGGTVTRLTDSWTIEPAFSPDGTELAYVKVRELKPHVHHSDVWVMPVRGGTPVRVADVPNRARSPVWSPDGKMIAFLAVPGGSSTTKELWIVPAPEQGKPVGAPTKIGLPKVTDNSLGGWTAENKVALFFPSPDYQATYTVPASGGMSTQVTPSGNPDHPRWSPDGKNIYYRSGPGRIASVPAGGGESSLIPVRSNSTVVEAMPGGGNDVSPDGKTIVFSAYKEGQKGVHIWTMPAQGGTPTQLTTTPADSRFPCWSPDGNTIAFISGRDTEENGYVAHIYTIPAEGGKVRQLTSESDRVAWSTVIWSPDGEFLAYFSRDRTIRVIPAAGGESRELVKTGRTDAHSGLAWSPDGRRLAYASQGHVWTVSMDGGSPTEIKTGLDEAVLDVAWSPDGKKLAFIAAKGGWEEPELWLMGNFLPKKVASK